MVVRPVDPPRARSDRTLWGDLRDDERGDVPGWVLITLMTAGLAIVILWGYLGPLLTAHE